MTGVRSDLALYRRLVGARLRSQLQYRVSFIVDLIGSFCFTFLDFVTVVVLFEHFPALDGWTLAEVALLYGISGIGIAVADMFIGNIEEISAQIRTGDFDVVLLRPAPTLLQVIASDLALRRLGRVAQSTVVLVYALANVGIDWTPARALLLPVGIGSAALVFGATFVLGASVMFWTVGSGEIAATFTYGGNAMTSYPLSVFGPWLRRMLAFVVPLGFVTYFPGLYLLDKPDPLGYPEWFQLAAPLAAVGFVAIAGAVWRVAVRHYRSSGS